MKRALSLLMVLATVELLSASATAQEQRFRTPWERSPNVFRGPETLVEGGVGLLALPTSKVCVVSPASCTRGDTSVTANLTLLYQPLKQLAIGTNLTFSPPTGSDTPAHSTPAIPRSHRRQYLLIDLVARDYVLQVRSTDVWLGVSVGGVVIYDFYKSDAASQNAPILGPTAITLRTEGLSTGLRAGASWAMFRDWSLIASARLSWWSLPSDRRCAPTGDCASLADSVPVFWMGVGVAYHTRI